MHLGQVAMGLVDTVFVGRLGKEAIAAVGLGNSIFFSLSVLGVGLVLGAEPLVSQAIGAAHLARAQRVLKEALLLAALATVPLLGLVALVLALLPFSGIDPDVVTLARDYVIGRSPGLLGFLLLVAMKGYLQARGQTRSIVTSIVVANLVNIPADGLLIFGDDGLRAMGLPSVGLPAWGVLGAGIATSIASWLRVVVVYPSLRRLLASDPPHNPLPLQAAGLRRMARIGLPIGLQMGVEVGLFAFVSVLMGWLGAEPLAAHQIALSLSSAPFQLTIGVGSATCVVVGQRIGARDPAGAKDAGAGGILLGLGVMLMSGALFLSVPHLLVGLFTDDGAVLGIAVSLVQIAGVFALSDGIQAVASGALRGAGDTRWPFAIHLVAHWLVGMPAAVGLGFGLQAGPSGMWWGLTAGLSFAAVALTWRFFRQARRGYAALDPSEVD